MVEETIVVGEKIEVGGRRDRLTLDEVQVTDESQVGSLMVLLYRVVECFAVNDDARASNRPSIDAPEFNQHGGAISSGFQLAVSGPDDAAYWLTTDGSDPRLADGTLNPTAILYAEPITLENDTMVKGRALKDNEWSALSEAEFFVGTVNQPGDANEDGRFDQADIVLVLQTGKYTTGQTASWADGDWNGDGLFNQLDIVLVLQTGDFAPTW